MAGEVLGSAVIEVGADTSGLPREVSKGVKNAAGKAQRDAFTAGQKTGKQFGGGVASGIRGTAGAIGLSLGAAGLAGFAAKSVRTAADFEVAMNTIRVAADVPAPELAKLSDLATDLGAKTVYSANEAANAMLELAKSGFKPAEIAGGGVQAVMSLAATEGLDLADAATITANAMAAFGIKAEKAAIVSSTLAAGSAASTASVASLAEGLGNVGAIANQTGLSLQDTVTALSILDANAIKGAEGGTALRSFLTALTPTTDKARNALKRYNLEFKNSDGSFRSLGEIAGDLRQELGKLGEAERAEALQTIFGTYAKQAASIFLKEGTKGFVEYGKEVRKTGVDVKLANARQEGLAGALEKAGGAIETAQKALGDALAPAIIDVSEAIQNDIVPAFTDFIAATREGEGVGADFIDALKLVLSTGKAVAGVINSLPGPVKEYGLEIAVAAVAINKLNTATAPGIARLKQLGAEMTYSTTRTQNLRAGLANLQTGLRAAAGAGGMIALSKGAQNSNEALGALELAAGGAALGFSVAGPWGAAITGTAAGLYGLKKAFNETATATNNAIIPNDNYTDSLRTGTRAITDQTRALVAKNAEETHAIEKGRALGLSSRTVVNAMMGYPPALAKVNAAQRKAEKSANGLNIVYDETGTAIVSISETATDAQKKQARAAAELGQIVFGNSSTLKEDIRLNNERALSLGNYNEVLHGVPPKVQSRIDLIGLSKAEQNIVGLTRKYDLVPDQVETILRAAGVQPTSADIKRIMDQVHALDKASANPKIDADTRRFYNKLSAVRREMGSLGNVIFGLAPGQAAGGTVIGQASGGTVPGARAPYGDKVLRALAPGEEVISNSRGQADRFRPLLKAINASSGVGSSSSVSSSSVMSAVAPESIVYAPVFNGPTTGSERLQELDWTIRFATRARLNRITGRATVAGGAI